MKGTILNQIRRAVASLTESTYLEVYGSGFKVIGRGLNSPYASHQEIEYMWEGAREYVVVLNAKHGLVIMKENVEYLPGTEYLPEPEGWFDIEEKWVGGELVPYDLVGPVIERVKGFGVSVPQEKLVRVFVRARTLGGRWYSEFHGGWVPVY